MTERKPHRVNFETWVDRQVREAMERGEFDNLPGAGKPIPGIDDPYDEMWWVKDKLRRENVSVLPPSLALRKEAEDALTAARQAGSESAVRQILTEINGRIRDAHMRPLAGPPLNLGLFDIERVVEQWKRTHSDLPGRSPNDQLTSGRANGRVGADGTGTDRRLLRRFRWRRFVHRR